MSESPMSPLVPHARFSQLDQVSITAPFRRSSNALSVGIANENDGGRVTAEYDVIIMVLI